ncbi:hypothetical protein [Sphingobacterium sp. LRF_L2]|uniref:hypothetical protein n=1 Tax=Sphingobacterium sp. LRF_L2 TaxID=3369421 RepID=UPI003F5E61BD
MCISLEERLLTRLELLWGEEAGVKIETGVGALFGGGGAVLGIIIGGVVGAIGGGLVGGGVADELYDKIQEVIKK